MKRKWTKAETAKKVERQRKRMRDPEYAAMHRARHVSNRRLRIYGLSREEYEEMHNSQRGRCKICRKRKLLCVDHDHSTGEVRGMLCQTCNWGLGSFKDNPVLLQAAITYLTNSAENRHSIEAS